MKSNKDKLGNIYDELLEELVKPLEKTYSKVGRAGELVEREFKVFKD